MPLVDDNDVMILRKSVIVIDKNTYKLRVSSDATASDTTTTIYNVASPTANSEESQALPSGCKGFIIRSRLYGNMKISYTSGESGTVYINIPAGSSYEDNHTYNSQTLYFQSDKSNDIIEVITFH